MPCLPDEEGVFFTVFVVFYFITSMLSSSMKRTVFFLFSILLAAAVHAQEFKFGCFSYEKVLQSMPDYAEVQRNLAQLQAQYDAETQRTEKEFNAKYEEFLDVQASLASTIRTKRQLELQDMMERGIAFKKEAKRLLTQAESDALAPVKARMAEAVKVLGREKGYAFILNTDNNVLPYVDETQGEDVTEVLIQRLASAK